MRILVICGAGASSTFVAMRLRHAAQNAGLSVQALAGTVESLAVDLDSTDILLVAPHLARELPDLEQLAAQRSVQVVLLPEDVFADMDGTHTLRVVLPALTTDLPLTPTDH
ncbi:MAG: PTS sugar transporter [Microbacterium sp.]|uniref:PTS sugar transporter subunit IIB n=1 Tax=Microbacterium sp. TaxID=51671 RepID=UPI002728DFC2|nr:PTS sugar transporter [Microbacterium sp.]MDO8382286.1 PTS sugar transporter [Microbacterium sp.]|tara:strand:- start:2030 stop:2362 length:333 start_codon:yes stop_codon:yes gene_type:complete